MSPKNVDIKEAVQLFFKNYTNFNGRSTRSEFWWVMLASFIVGFVLGILSALTPIFTVIAVIFCIAIIVPSIAVEIRRLHDTGKSGWFILICLVPMVGSLILLYFLAQPSDPNSNQYGDPAV
ncbi:MAG TPA: DUF805 domain-containing protein [Ruminococcus sp.]|nr:DUF805 domain-containing protein [Ruminococcus sp.]